MALNISTGLANSLLDSDCLKNIMEGAGNTGFFIDIYSGTRPTSADTSPSGAKLLTLYSDGVAAGLHFAATATTNVLSKASGETWSGTVTTAGVAGYFRIRAPGDTAATSTTEPRIDGTIGVTAADLVLSSTTFDVGAPFTLATATFTLPLA